MEFKGKDIHRKVKRSRLVISMNLLKAQIKATKKTGQPEMKPKFGTPAKFSSLVPWRSIR